MSMREYECRLLRGSCFREQKESLKKEGRKTNKERHEQKKRTKNSMSENNIHNSS